MGPSDRFLKTQEVADALGMSVSSAKRWVDRMVESGRLRVVRTSGNQRRIPLSDVIALARSEQLPVEGLEGLSESETLPIGTLPLNDSTRDLLARLLQDADNARAKALLHAVFAQHGAVALADRLLQPVMERIGHGWMVGQLDVYQEHKASQTVSGVLSELNERASRAGDTAGAPIALGATPEGDIYTLSVLLGELALRELGWDVRNLGPNLPLRSLTLAVEEYRPRLVFLSINHLADPERFAREYEPFWQAAVRNRTAVMLGGRALSPDLRRRLVYTSYGEALAHLAALARGLWFGQHGERQPGSARDRNGDNHAKDERDAYRTAGQ